ncbi:MAG: TlpA family protein disulfide reductase [Pyrinomonadaceae bacterium]|nr:TlpA family protein disulfide reductase [Pyrinomonadaceae bacterium]
MRSLILWTLVLWTMSVNGFASAEVRAQTNSAPASPATAVSQASTAAALYQEAFSYTRKRFDELARSGAPFDPKLAEKIETEQRELAARHAAQLAARSGLANSDLYYLGLLYSLAGQSDEVITTMRRYLAEHPTASDEQAEVARFVFVLHAVKKNLLPEAENVLAAYASAKKQRPNNRFLIENTLAAAYRNNKQLVPAVTHARAAFEAAKLISAEPDTKAPQVVQQRDQRLFIAASTLVDLYLEIERRDEATRVLGELRQLALSLPSANLHEFAMRKTAITGLEVKAAQAGGSNDAGIVAGAPELAVIEWIDQRPFKIADLQGSVVLLDFWATWCGPCRITFPKLRNWHEKYKDKGLVIVGVTRYYGTAEGRPVTPREELNYLKSFKLENRLPYGFAVAKADENNLTYGVPGIPTAVLIDRRGQVRFITVGASAQKSEALGKMIDKLINEPKGRVEAPGKFAGSTKSGS